tara:strand:+ start:457 stop:714 length:258 start_codon:yes stop_codon:yes gene_type:complete
MVDYIVKLKHYKGPKTGFFKSRKDLYEKMEELIKDHTIINQNNFLAFSNILFNHNKIKKNDTDDGLTANFFHFKLLQEFEFQLES